jgi:hypothetical protein
MFNPSEQESSRYILPVGVYTFHITRIKLESSKKDPSCKYFSCTYENNDGAKAMDMFIWEHNKNDVRKFGRARLADLCFATGFGDYKFKDTEEIEDTLLNRSFVGKVYHGKDQNGEPQARLGGYYNISIGENRGKQKIPKVTVEEDVPF